VGRFGSWVGLRPPDNQKAFCFSCKNKCFFLVSASRGRVDPNKRPDMLLKISISNKWGLGPQAPAAGGTCLFLLCRLPAFGMSQSQRRLLLNKPKRRPRLSQDRRWVPSHGDDQIREHIAKVDVHFQVFVAIELLQARVVAVNTPCHRVAKHEAYRGAAVIGAKSRLAAGRRPKSDIVMMTTLLDTPFACR
jgi:hypothetical protein